MEIKTVNTRAEQMLFLNVVANIYKNDPNYIRPLDTEIENTFNPKKNKAFRNGGCAERWIVLNDENQAIGRIAAFLNPKAYGKKPEKWGAIGFFESINKAEVANLLLSTAINWLKAKECTWVQGPVNFGERDKFWGLLISGFTPPVYSINYNPPYYQAFFEDFGFEIDFKQYVYNRQIHEPLQEKYETKAIEFLRNPAVRASYVDINKPDKFAQDFITVYNSGWAKLMGLGFNSMKKEQALAIFKTMKPIMDPKTVWFLYHNNEAIAFFICVPDINQIIKKLNGNFNWWGKLKFLFYQKTMKIDRVYGLIFGVVPDFHGKGAESAIVKAAADGFYHKQQQYKELELTWIGDFNPKMMNVASGIGAEVIRVLHTYKMRIEQFC